MLKVVLQTCALKIPAQVDQSDQVHTLADMESKDPSIWAKIFVKNILNWKHDYTVQVHKYFCCNNIAVLINILIGSLEQKCKQTKQGNLQLLKIFPVYQSLYPRTLASELWIARHEDIKFLKPVFRLNSSLKISAHADGGPRFRVCARLTLRLPPHEHERKFVGARVWGKTYSIFSDQFSQHFRWF